VPGWCFSIKELVLYEKNRLNYRGDEKSLDGILHRQIVDFLPKNKYINVLDYGAGNSPYRNHINSDFYQTADISQNSAGDIDFLLINGPKLPLDDKSVDLILLMDVLEHVDEPGPLLIELSRLLSSEGRLVISLPFIYREHETPSDFYRYTLFGAEKLLSDYGGSIHRVAKVGNIWYTILSLFIERKIYHGEKNKLNYFGLLVNKLLRLLVPLLARFLKSQPSIDAGVYHHLLLEVKFS
jgi:SAM-dependent methyltransferase